MRGLGQLIGLTFFLGMGLAVLVSCLTGKAAPDNPYVWLLYGIVGWLIFVGIWIGVAWVREAIRETKLARALCPHGISGGQSRMLCSQCKQRQLEAEGKLEQERVSAERTKKIAVDANRLRKEEFARLTKLRTHKIDFLLNLSPADFEGVVATMYREMGYFVEQTPLTNDFGRDLILKRDGQTIFVECKRYAKDKLIGRPALQKFYAAVATLKADSGILVTTSSFAATAVKFAAANRIKLIDGSQLAALMIRAFPSSDDANEYKVMCAECGDVVLFDARNIGQEAICRNGHTVNNDLRPDSLTFKALSETPYCDRCGEQMRLRKSYRGRFWGCPNYPKCRCTKPYTGNRK